jgi:hypothetical protein
MNGTPRQAIAWVTPCSSQSPRREPDEIEVRSLGANRRVIAIVALALASLTISFVFAGPAQAGSGGLSGAPDPPPTEAPSGEASVSTLAGERAVAPAGAPTVVKEVIAAANRIRSTPYVWGGGHARWWDRGYDCSGSVSYALHGGGLLEAPMVSGSFMTWGQPGPGTWITIYANRKHVYAVIAGLRWDTGGDVAGTTGPRWHAEPPYPKGFVVRHPVGY